MKTKTALISPLNWGLGHASRCIPIINDLVQDGFEVIIVGNGESLRFLQSNFPDLKSEKIAKQRYGAGSEIKDLALPCGGAIEVTFIPLIETKKISQFLCELRARRAVSFEIENDILIGSGRLRVEPKLAIRIAGKGADLLALSRLAQVAGYRVRAQTPDAESAADLQRAGHFIAWLKLTFHSDKDFDHLHNAWREFIPAVVAEIAP